MPVSSFFFRCYQILAAITAYLFRFCTYLINIAESRMFNYCFEFLQRKLCTIYTQAALYSKMYRYLSVSLISKYQMCEKVVEDFDPNFWSLFNTLLKRPNNCRKQRETDLAYKEDVEK